MNVELLRKVKEHILEDPLRLCMGTWATNKSSFTVGVAPGRSFPECGTVACIAGWACILSNGKQLDYNLIASEAQKLLGLSEVQARRLFLVHHWPSKFRYYDFDDGMECSAEAAAARIEHFIETDGQE